ncbi:uncharacterized protein EI97DRAFT_295504 [Westerdykella ornata]|uniref:Uncharacterized protein n=1 Tax=Westerdykella ornata TaxID=318751 RepID=A0A6A6JMQ3_WESOR|nr:uncharacterized protein EI97DRAFT_295504 [Westerdykella ornata]KAF2277505.1 hypothetical protein EI97DRAFT_295504 [Westerdykella ornata]
MAQTSTRSLPLAYHGRCDKHEETSIFFKCNGTRTDGTPCTSSPRSEPYHNYLPTCGRHKHQMIEAARCEAIESCGKPCYRLSAADPPFNLCLIHCGGTSTLRCYLMELPAEIRMMILGYVLPAKVPARRYHRSVPWKTYGLDLAILKMNKQICRETLDVLYGKSEFEVIVTHDKMSMMDRTWKRPSAGGSVLTWTQVHPPSILQRIRKVKLRVLLGGGTVLLPLHVGEPSSWMNHITGIDSSLFQSRDMVRKLVWVLQSNKMTHLSVEPELQAPSTWEADEVMAAIRLALEPFRELTVLKSRILGPLTVTYHRRNRNSSPVTRHVGAPNPRRAEAEDGEYRLYQRNFSTELPMHMWSGRLPLPRPAVAALRLYAELELFSSAVFMKNPSLTTPAKASDSEPFSGLDRVMHLARLAHEQCDLVMLETIKSAVLQRWCQNTHVASLQGRQVGYAARLLLRSSPVVPPAAVPPQYVDRRWDMLRMGRPPRFAGTTGQQHAEELVMTEDEARVYYHLPGRGVTWSMPKTPQMVRAARERARQLRGGYGGS